MRFVILIFGFFGLIAQVLLLRQLAVVFHGTELYLGAALASWLLLTAMGSGLMGWVGDRVRRPLALLARCFCALGLLLPATLVLVRAAPRLFLGPTGAVVPYWKMGLVTFGVLAPLCLLIGFVFTLACRIAAGEGQGGGLAIGRVYVREALGTCLGGLAFTFVLVGVASPLQIAAGLGFLVAGTALALRRHPGFRLNGEWLLLTGAALALLALGVPPLSTAVDLATTRLLMPGYALLESQQSPYGDVSVGQRGEQVVFFSDGSPIATNEDVEFAELGTHLPLLAHPNPRRVLVIGGGPSGFITRVLEHPTVERVDYVELDPVLVSYALRYAAKEDRDALRAPRVTIHGDVDGRRFIKEAKGRYDVIILDQPDPTTGVVNRFYTLEFFREVSRCLESDGIVSLRLSGSPAYMSRELRVLSASIYRTLREVFPNVRLIGCDATNYFLASSAPLGTDAETLVKRFEERKLRPYWLTSAMVRYYASPQRTLEVLAPIESESDVALNTDFRPVTYYYAVLYRQRLFATGETRSSWERISLPWILGGAAALGLLVWLWARRLGDPRRVSVPAVLLCVGFAGIVLEMVLIVVFQSLYGYAYHYLGLIFSSFMLGLALGGAGGIAASKNERRAPVGLAAAVGVLALYAAALPPLFQWLQRSGAGEAAVTAHLVFPLLTVIVGLLVGFLFPLAVHAYKTGETGIGKKSGVLYGMDLLGSCIGALGAGALLIPVLGLLDTCYAVAGVCIVGAGLFVLSERAE